MTATTLSPEAADALTPGEWTPTGWGVRHRVRRSDEQWTEMVCHRGPLPRSTEQRNDRVATGRIDRGADETKRCRRCAALPDFGPMVLAPRGEVRRSPGGVLAFAKLAPTGDGYGGFGRVGGGGWRPAGWHPEVCTQSGGWLGDWDVAGWQIVGNVYDLTEPVPIGTDTVRVWAGFPIPVGEVRRHPDEASRYAVCHGAARPDDSARRESLAYPDVRWSLLGDDPEHGYGWRTDEQVSWWVRVGNVYELARAGQ